MTSSVELSHLVDAAKFTSLRPSHNENKSRNRHILKQKQNTLKLKCSRALKRKLKKYKLRQDGQEDQDIIDISDVLITTLIIRSPNSTEEKTGETDLNEIELLRPKNYLFKMISAKQVNDSLKENKSYEIAEEDQNNYCSNSQERKQTDAFKLLMDSRNKIIGSNSPGKDKEVSDALYQEEIENKNIQAKRFVVLQKMAEKKGSTKIKEMEEYKEKYAERQLKKRADTFKNMLLKQKCKTLKLDKNNKLAKTGNEGSVINQSCVTSIKKETKSLQLINIFAESESSNNLEVNKVQMNKEDEEFLDKLSPSLKKKENMLCYFKKIEKERDCSVSSENENKIIKVKFTPKSKKKEKKQKLRVKKEIVVDHNDNSEKNNISKILQNDDICTSTNKETYKRKRNHKSTTTSNGNDTEYNINIEISDNRPKRNIKKPVKYSEDFDLSSSDEELHIFTPKKKKHDNIKISSSISQAGTSEQNIMHKTQNTEALLKLDKLTNKPEQHNGHTKKYKQIYNITKKSVKLAPIFNSKPTPDMAAVEAKQKFLKSGVPNQLKKIMSQQNAKSSYLECFKTVVHIQQKDASFANNLTKDNYFCEKIYLNEEIDSAACEENLFGTLLNLNHCQLNFIKKSCFSKNISDVLNHMKENRPRYPIYRTYRMLRDKRKGEFKGNHFNDLDNSREVINSIMDINIENPDQLSWCDRYKATSTNQIIGNFDSINEMKKWLVSWSENQSKGKNNSDSDLSDFCLSETESKDNFRNCNNLLILSGPVGSGKTSSVYTVASELSIKVIEVNVSNKRSGKIILQDLQEATQSHKVNRGASASETSQKSQEIVIKTDEINKRKNRGRSKKNIEKSNKLKSEVKCESGPSTNQNTIRTDSSLILIDDADIVFDQDDGFSSAIVQLVQSSKRPVILVISSLTCQHLQRFLQNGKILKMKPLLPKILGTWLDIMCLADTGLCFPGSGAKFLNYFKGDIRKTINTLHFYMSTQPQNLLNDDGSQNVITPNLNSENSNTSWINCEDSHSNNSTEKTITYDSDYVWDFFANKECNLLYLHNQLNRFDIWWGLNFHQKDKQNNNAGSIDELQSIANAIDSISLSDYFNNSNKITNVDVTSKPWSSCEMNNVSELENMSLYAKTYETNEDICYDLVKNSITAVQKTLENEDKNHVHSPEMAVQSIREKIVSRHKDLGSYLNPSSVLDRRSLALDYWPACRTLCMVERRKTDVHTKRKLRYCHYLKSLNILCKNETFELLSDSLCFNK